MAGLIMLVEVIQSNSVQIVGETMGGMCILQHCVMYVIVLVIWREIAEVSYKLVMHVVPLIISCVIVPEIITTGMMQGISMPNSGATPEFVRVIVGYHFPH